MFDASAAASTAGLANVAYETPANGWTEDERCKLAPVAVAAPPGAPKRRKMNCIHCIQELQS